MMIKKKKNNFKIKKFLIVLFFIVFALFVNTKNTSAITVEDLELLDAMGLINWEQMGMVMDDLITILGLERSGIPGAIVGQSDLIGGKTCLVLEQDLYFGLSGTAVSALQNFLKSEGYFNTEINGQFGLITKSAVTDFQLDYGLIAYPNQTGAGNVGPLTRAKIQEISCSSVNESREHQLAEIYFDPVTITEGPSDYTIRNTSSKTTDQKVETTIETIVLDEDIEKGETEIRYKLLFEPEVLIDKWVVTLYCNEENVEVLDADKIEECNYYAVYDPNSKGDKYLKMKFRNSSKTIQEVFVIAEVLNERDQVIDTMQVKNELSVQKQVVSTEEGFSYEVVGGELGYSLEPRKCTEEEQLNYLKYVMTRNIKRKEDRIVSPICWPGDIKCTFDYPPSYCEIIDGPNSLDLCENEKYFYDGECIDSI
jgi:hypothetical protein